MFPSRNRTVTRRLVLTAALAATAYLVNQWQPTLGSPEMPNFLFGGVFVLAAFVRLGPVSGVVVGVVSLWGSLSQLTPAGLATVVYLAEGLFVWALYRRTRSIVLADLIFWVTLGPILDALLYGAWTGLTVSYLALLFVKQLFNGTLNAVLAEVLVDLPGARVLTPDRLPSPPLRRYVFSRLSVGFIGLAAVTALFLTRARLEGVQADFDAGIQDAAFRTSEDVQAYLLNQSRDLEILSVRIAIADRSGTRAEVERALRDFLDRHETFINVAWVDAEGESVASEPTVSATGEPVVYGNASDRGYFREARRTRAPTVSPLIMGGLRIRYATGPEPIVVLAVPILSEAGEFDGIVLGAIDAVGLRSDILSGTPLEGEPALTLLDGENRVVWSSISTRPIGSQLNDPLAGAAPSGRVFTYQPPEIDPDSPSARLGTEPARATLNRAEVFDLAVLAEMPSAAVHIAMAPHIAWVILLYLLTAGVVVLTTRRLADRLSAPLAGASEVVRAVAAGAAPAEREHRRIETLDVAEVTGLSRTLREMELAVATARETSAAQVAASERRFRVTFERSGSGIAHTDPGGRVLLMNGRYREILGEVEVDDLTGWNLRTFTHPDDRAEEEAALAPLLAGEAELASYQVRVLRSDGESRWVDVSCSRVAGSPGEAPYLIHVAHDVTDRRLLTDRLIRKGRLESIGRLAAGVAHDLNNMLTPVLGYAQLAAEDVPDDGEVADSLTHIVRSTTRAKGVVSQLLAFGRRQTLQMEPLSANEAVGEFQEVFGSLLRADVQIVENLESGLPRIRADRAQLQQVLINLFTNSQDAMPRGGRIHLTTRTVLDPERLEALPGDVPAGVEIVVQDEGPGVRPEHLPHLFEPFFTTKEVGKGTGLGLASVYGIVEQMEGRIEASSPPGEGLRLSLLFPTSDRVARPAASGPAAGISDEMLLGTVLVVEDEPEVLGLVRRTLLRGGAREVVTAHHAEAALDAVRSRDRLDLLITDVVLPGMRGPQLARELKRIFPELPVIYMSGYSRDVLGQDGVLPPDVRVLAKPFDLDALRSEIAAVRVSVSTSR